MRNTVLAKNKQYHILGGSPDGGLVSCVSSRYWGDMSLNCADESRVLVNRSNFLNSLGIDYRDLVCAKQIHSVRIKQVSRKDRGRGAVSYAEALADTDALITDRVNLPLAVFTADCLAIFVYDTSVPAIGLIHAGWKGSREAIAAKTIELMGKTFNTKPKNLLVGFGPLIRDCCYQVQKEFIDFFPHGIKRRNGKLYFDLAAVNKKQLMDSGVKNKNISDAMYCTFCRAQEFFSYRRQQGACGRMMSVMMLRDKKK